MKVDNRNLSSGGTATCRAQETAGDDLHLSELVRSLRALASDSPERQAKLEELARMYAAGSYTVDVTATAAKIIDDAIEK